MNRNDYRRAFIMLRAARPGYGGHARLERRTMTGSLYFIVTAPENSGPLQAALVGRTNGRYYAAPLGALARDRRGQLALAYTFDPRNIDGRPLDAFYWAAIADTGSGCAVVLTGNVDGSRDVDHAALEAAVCALYAAPDAPAADLPDDDLPCPVTPIAVEAPADTTDETPSVPASETAPAPTREAPAAPTDSQADPSVPAESDVKIYTRARRSTLRQAQPDAVSAQPEPAAEPAPAESAASAETAPSPQTAAQALKLDITQPWPAPAEPLRRLFATQVPAQAPLGDGYVYIESAIPTGGDRDTCYVGLRASDGHVTGIRYAVPGQPAPEPPAGLDDYVWHDAGYWVLDIGIS